MYRMAMVVVLASIVGAWAGPAAAREHWRRPVASGTLTGAFTYLRAEPYAAGRRRGMDWSVAPGARVAAACGGAVTFAGRVPGGWGRGVTVRCAGGDGLVATELGLGPIAVRSGSRVLAGATLGRAG